ncbi:MAG: MFS transporter, partial [Proteobacteria bacterium]|nr:MFS transporter [Pseudomonadota bacterium]
ASTLPWVMANWLDVPNTAPDGEVPLSVKLSFYVGSAAFLLAVSWTVFRTREYPPGELAAFEAVRDKSGEDGDETLRPAARYRNGGLVWVLVGAIGWYLVAGNGLDKQLFILAGGFIAFGILQVLTAYLQNGGHTRNGFYEVMHDRFHMPRVMKQLAVVQFFSWFALFAMWIYGGEAVAFHHFGATGVGTQAYNDGVDWNGVLFGAYNGFAALAAIAIPFVANHLGCRVCHLVNLWLGGIGLISFYFVSNPQLLLVSELGVGMAWASILSLPYALLSNNLPARKMGVYMGIFNFFIVIPQLVAASLLGLLLREFFDLQPIFGLVIGGVSLLIAGVLVLLVDKSAEPTG